MHGIAGYSEADEVPLLEICHNLKTSRSQYRSVILGVWFLINSNKLL